MSRCIKSFKHLLLTAILGFPLLLSAQVKTNNQDSIALNSLLKKLIIEALSEKRKKATDTLPKLRQDSTVNARNINGLITELEKNNFPLENTAATPTPLFASPVVLTDSTEFLKSHDRYQSFEELRRRKRIHRAMRHALNVAALADLITKDQNRLNTLLDDLVKNSGKLIASLILGKDSQGQEDIARSIVIDYLNKNLERLTGETPNNAQEAPLPITAVPPSAPPTFNANKHLYLSPQVQFAALEAWKTKMEDTLRRRNTYAFINYSQDVSTETYLARAKGTRPKGLPPEAKFIAATLVNIPGSVKVNMVGCAPGAKATATDNEGEILEGCLEGGEDGALIDDSPFVLATLRAIREAYGKKENLVLPERNKNSFVGHVKLDNGEIYDITLFFKSKERLNNLVYRYDNNTTTLITDKHGVAVYSSQFAGNEMVNVLINDTDKYRQVKINSLTQYLFTIPKNIILFVNGYRKVDLLTDALNLLKVELPRGDDKVHPTDLNQYWEGIDQQFYLRIGGQGLGSMALYADGHHPITTSNHNVNNNYQDSKLDFLSSMLTSDNARTQEWNGKDIPNKCYHNPSCVVLHKTANVGGFNTRVENGRNAGQNLLDQLKAGNLGTAKKCPRQFYGDNRHSCPQHGLRLCTGYDREAKRALQTRQVLHHSTRERLFG
jgi:hypothetical protein